MAKNNYLQQAEERIQRECFIIDYTEHETMEIGYYSCPRCGRRCIEIKFEFCPQCGVELDWVESK